MTFFLLSNDAPSPFGEPRRIGVCCLQIRKMLFWQQCDRDLRWLIHNWGPTKQAFDMATYYGLSFEMFLASLECPNGCAQLPPAKIATRICPVCHCTGKTTPKVARLRVTAMQREFFTVRTFGPYFNKPNPHN